MGKKKAPQSLRCCIKSLWTDRVNVQEVKNSSLATTSGLPDNLQTQHHNHKPKVHRRPRHPLPFRSGPGSAATIGIYWRMLNGQFIMARIKKTNGSAWLSGAYRTADNAA
jgi:hypothetical protein